MMKRRTFLLSASLLIPANAASGQAPAPGADHRFQRARSEGRQFLGDLFDPAIGLLPEYKGASVYWLFHDNYFAAKTLRLSHPGLSRRLERAIRRYGVTRSGKIEIVFDEAQQPLPFRHPELIEVARVGDKIVKTEILTDRTMVDWQQYGDLLLMAALATHRDDPVAARARLAEALAMWDGVGLKDRVTELTARYAVYKLALAVLAANRLEQRPPALDAMLDRLLAQQSSTGGWITDYTADRKPAGLANVETTCLAVLALDSISR
jgi:hypothetical protein